jgi:hypothetical protein
LLVLFLTKYLLLHPFQNEMDSFYFFENQGVSNFFWFFTTFQELLFCVPQNKDKNLVLWHTERNYRVIN